MVNFLEQMIKVRGVGDADGGADLFDRQIGSPKQHISVFGFLFVEKIDHSRAGVAFEEPPHIIGVVGELFDDIGRG